MSESQSESQSVSESVGELRERPMSVEGESDAETPTSGRALPRRSGELVPLGERVQVLMLLRLVMVGVAIGVASLSRFRTLDFSLVLEATGGYVAIQLLVEVARNRVGRSLFLLAVGLLIDGLWLATVSAATTSTASPLLRLVEIHTVAVTLLASYRTGLKIALWHSLLLDGVYQLKLGSTAAHPGQLTDLIVATSALWGLALGAAVFSAVNERELRRRRVELQALVTLSAKLDRAGGPEGMAEVLATMAADTFVAERAVVLGRRGDTLEPLAGYGAWEAAEHLAPGAAVRRAWDLGNGTGPGAVGRFGPGVAGTAVLLSRVRAETDPDLAALLPGGRHLVVLPMLAEGAPVGVLVLEMGRRVRERIERRMVDTAGQFAAHAALAMQNAWLLREVGRLAATDALTGLANRRTLATDLERALSRARRTGKVVSMVLVDVDHFKAVNDEHGHRTGDELLRCVADVLAAVAGGSATAARYGGEEFALLLPDASAEAARRVAEAVRRAVPAGTSPRVTISAGVATVRPGSGIEPDLISEADRALYAAKRAGRDRIVHVDELESDVPASTLPHPATIVLGR